MTQVHPVWFKVWCVGTYHTTPYTMWCKVWFGVGHIAAQVVVW